jgi:ring-1,2-phenylacetyl-CoA epoxidase subunit PaaC
MIDAGIGADPIHLQAIWRETVSSVLTQATLTMPADGWMQRGGRQGQHSEHLGRLLTDLQYMQRAFPGAKW